MIERIRAISHGLRARFFAAALLVPLMAVVMATSGAELRCRLTGEVSNACCCDDATSAAAPVATVSEADCCDRVLRDVTTTPAELSATASALPDRPTPVAHVAFEAPAVDPFSGSLSSRSETRASLRPPTVRLRLVSKSSFLI